jgi:membrane protease YdiL (CAAX protease family)
MRTSNGLKQEPRVLPFSQSACEDTSKTISSRSKSSLVFFLLIVALSVPLWVLGLFVEVRGLPKNMQVTEPALAFTPLTAASIPVYKEDKLAGVKALLKRLFDFERTKHKIWYVPTILLMPLVYLLSYVGVRLLGMSLPVQPEIPFMAIPPLLVLCFIGAAGEELGYSGYATDPMQERFSALKAGLIIGSFWAL